MDTATTVLLAKSTWFAELAVSRRNLLLREAQLGQLGDREQLYRTGDPSDGLHAVIAGEIRLISYPAVGSQLMNLLLKPGAWFGELSVLDNGPRPHDAVTYNAATILSVSPAALERAFAADSGLVRDVAVLACRHQRAALQYVGEVLSLPAATRLARVLFSSYQIRSNDQSASPLEEVRMTQEDLAGIIGVSRQTINRMLRKLESGGCIKNGYASISVADPRRLEIMCRYRH